MAETTNILWMGEELDFELSTSQANAAGELLDEFLESAGHPDLTHTVVRPSDNIPTLDAKLQAAHADRPFTGAVDLTGGEVFDRLTSLQGDVPVWKDFSMSRIRQGVRAELTTSGYLLSHNADEMRDACQDIDTSNLLVLDDTSFSGSTSVVFEGLMRKAMPDRDIRFNHGFLIANIGRLGVSPGARDRLESIGSQVLAGLEMETPSQDGWHVFDIVKQPNLREHLMVMASLAKLQGQQNGAELAAEYLSDSAVLQVAFPKMLSTDELLARQAAGHFLATEELNGDFHVRNPQILPGAIQQGHLSPVEGWKRSESETLGILAQLGDIFEANTRTA